MKMLILGGARSGKSKEAESQAMMLAEREFKALVYVATSTKTDSEMEKRIEHHQHTRSDLWYTVEEPVNLANVLNEFATENYVVLVDCLTLWLNNCLFHQCWDSEREDFLSAFHKSAADIILVSNEVGSGVIPLGELSREFVDESGRLHQQLAPRCHKVSLVVAGLPLTLK